FASASFEPCDDAFTRAAGWRAAMLIVFFSPFGAFFSPLGAAAFFVTFCLVDACFLGAALPTFFGFGSVFSVVFLVAMFVLTDCFPSQTRPGAQHPARAVYPRQAWK